jgi:hypothetical protein
MQMLVDGRCLHQETKTTQTILRLGGSNSISLMSAVFWKELKITLGAHSDGLCQLSLVFAQLPQQWHHHSPHNCLSNFASAIASTQSGEAPTSFT